MPLFRRRGSANQPSGVAPAVAGVDDFWQWWTCGAADEVERCIGTGDFSPVVGALASAVREIHSRLDWELGPGATSQHRLVVTAAGDPGLRAVARRWRSGAPAATPTWEYADTRQPVEGPVVLDIDGHTVHAADVTVRVDIDEPRAQVDVRVEAAALTRMKRDTALKAVFLLLDQVLGEEVVETWVGGISVAGHSGAAEPSPGAEVVGLAELPGVVRRFAEGYVCDGEPVWNMTEGRSRDGGRLLAMARVPLKPMTAPHLDHHVRVDLGFVDRTDDGLPGPVAVQRLRALEDHLASRVGNSGAVLAHETSSGRRTLHLYVDSTTPAAEQVRVAVGGWTEGPVRVSEVADPAWAHVAHLR